MACNTYSDKWNMSNIPYTVCMAYFVKRLKKKSTIFNCILLNKSCGKAEEKDNSSSRVL